MTVQDDLGSEREAIKAQSQCRFKGFFFRIFKIFEEWLYFRFSGECWGVFLSKVFFFFWDFLGVFFFLESLWGIPFGVEKVCEKSSSGRLGVLVAFWYFLLGLPKEK